MEKEKKKVPAIRLKGFTDEWEQRKFGEMFERRKERNNGQFDKTRWISVAKMYFQEPEKVTSNNIDTRTYVMRIGDIAFEGHPNSDHSLGRFVENDIGDGVISELFPIFRHKGEYDLNYWKYTIQLERIMYSKLVNCIEISYTSSNKLDEVFFLKESILVPSLKEQKKLGDFFKNIDNLITIYQRKCDQLKMLKAYFLQNMFPAKGEKVPKIRFKGFTGDWEKRKLGDVLETITDYVAAGSFADIAKNVKYKNSPDYAQLIRTIDLKNGFTSSNMIFVDKKAFDYLYRVNINKECIILPNIGNCGEVYYVKPENLPYKHNVLGPNAIFVRSETIENGFLSILFQAKDFQTKLKLIISPTGQTKFNKTELKDIDLILPSAKDEQKKISFYFENLDNLITLHQRKVEELQTLKKFLLQNMFI